MTHLLLRVLPPVALGVMVLTVSVTARSAEPAPKPDTYLCPHATGGAVDCFLHAIEHLYTMCRQVKSIEIIEFGYEKSAEGTNGAKSTYCFDKHRQSMARPYQSALREARTNRMAVDGLRALHELWLNALAELKWIPGESDDQYKARVTKPYDVFSERAGTVRAVLAANNDKAVSPTGKGKTATAAKASPRPKSAN